MSERLPKTGTSCRYGVLEHMVHMVRCKNTTVGGYFQNNKTVKKKKSVAIPSLAFWVLCLVDTADIIKKSDQGYI